MTEEQQDALTAYVTALQDALGLSAWEVLVSTEEPVASNGHEAGVIDGQVTIADEGRHATLRVHADFFTAFEGDPAYRAEAQRQTVTHELLHLATDWPISDLLDDVKALATEREYGLIEHRAGQSYERMVDAMAQSIAPLLPLPTWDTVGSDDADTQRTP